MADTIQSGLGEITLNGFLPTITVSDNILVNPLTGSIVLEGNVSTLIISGGGGSATYLDIYNGNNNAYTFKTYPPPS